MTANEYASSIVGKRHNCKQIVEGWLNECGRGDVVDEAKGIAADIGRPEARKIVINPAWLAKHFPIRTDPSAGAIACMRAETGWALGVVIEPRGILQMNEAGRAEVMPITSAWHLYAEVK